MAYISEPMAPATEQSLFPIDETTEIIWPENMPEPPELEEELETTEGAATSIEEDNRSWTDLVEEQVARMPEIRRMSMRRLTEHLYSHLPHSQIDWEFDGPSSACRVVGLSCFGQDYKSNQNLGAHLRNKPHTTKAADCLSPPTSTKKQRLEHTVKSSELVGHDLELPLKPSDEALELSMVFKYPFWLEVPDSDADEE
ncbi:hypothetical protein FSHL1_007735 [Fusarium sambucinum]